MHIVFLGNCQVAATAAILRRFVGPYVGYTSDFVNAYERVEQSSYTRLAAADIVVAQSASQPPCSRRGS